MSRGCGELSSLCACTLRVHVLTLQLKKADDFVDGLLALRREHPALLLVADPLQDQVRSLALPLLMFLVLLFLLFSPSPSFPFPLRLLFFCSLPSSPSCSLPSSPC